jgi:hypothetical protein
MRQASPALRIPLGRRRRERRKRLFFLALAAFLVLFALIEVVLWLPMLRVQEVHAEGVNSEQVGKFVNNELGGTRYLVIPKSSIFFIPQKDIRAHVLAAFPDVEAISIAPSGLTTLHVTLTERASVLWWCGTTREVPFTTCYQADAQGLIFAQVPAEEMLATSSMLSIYAPLASPLAASPIGNSIVGPKLIPPMIQFVKAMRTLGADVVSVGIRGDEADLYTRAGTRITYVLGREQQAAALATSAFPTLALNDGTLLYVDLRFDSKVFFKKK